MTPNHTPGPWDLDFPYVVAADPGGRHPDLYIAEIVQDDEEDRIPPGEEQDGNARLLAAAPELFDALVGLLDEIDRPTPSDGRPDVVAHAREVVAAVLDA